MVAPAVIAAGISAGSSLLGGLLNRSENRRRERRADPANVRKRFEAAGFNPLLGVGAMNAPVQYGPTMGDAVANAGSLAMSAYNQTHQLEMQRAELEMANQRLTELAEQSRLRPTYPGPYQGSGSHSYREAGNGPSVPEDNAPRPMGGSVFTGAGPIDVGPDGYVIRPRSVDGPLLVDAGEAQEAQDKLTAMSETVPQMRVGGVTLTGSGAFSTGEAFEQNVGEGPLQWLHSGLVLGDMVVNTGRNAVRNAARAANRARETEYWDRVNAPQDNPSGQGPVPHNRTHFQPPIDNYHSRGQSAPPIRNPFASPATGWRLNIQ